MADRNFVGMSSNRQQYALPSLNVTAFPDHRRIRYLGSDNDLVQGVEVSLSGVTVDLTWNEDVESYGGVRVFAFDTGNVSVLNCAVTGGISTASATTGASQALMIAVGTTTTGNAYGSADSNDYSVAVASTTMASHTGTAAVVSTSPVLLNGMASAKSIVLNFWQEGNVTANTSVTFASGAKLTVLYTLLQP